MKLVPFVVQNFRVFKQFPDTDRINSIDFSSNGNVLVTSNDDDSIEIFDCENGTPSTSVPSKKYGVDLIRATDLGTRAVHCSTKIDDTIRYLSLHDNKYIRYFTGHVKRVVSLSVSPLDQTIISGSLDKTVRLWDVRSPNCQGCISVNGRPATNFDPEGVIFAIAENSEGVKLYDIRSFDKGPFNSYALPKDGNYEWTDLKFSHNGKMILISTNGSAVHLMDAYHLKPLTIFTSRANSKSIPLEASFSPDSQFIFSGSTDGTIHVWSSESGSRTAVLEYDRSKVVHLIQFNPKYMMLASASSEMAFWLPDMPDDEL